MKTHLSMLALVVLFLLLPRSAPARGPDFLKNYKDGLAAVEAEDWGRAERRMRSAIEERGKEAKRLPKFLYVKPYLPHFYLGLSLFEQGNCSAALGAWAVSERQGVIQNRPQFEDLTRGRELCRERTRVSENPTQRAPAPRSSESRSVPSPPPSSRPSQELAVSSRPPAPSVAPRFGGPDPRLPAVTASPPSDLLRSAAASFLDGSYADVMELLSTDVPSDAFSKAQGQLLMAASEMALFLAGGERDTKHLERSRQHVLGVRRALPDFEPPEKYFSPRFLDFFYGQRPREER